MYISDNSGRDLGGGPTPAPIRNPQADVRFLVVLTAGSLAIRLLCLAFSPAVPPIVDLDAVDYDQIARHLAVGEGFGYGPGMLSSFRPPLYPMFLAAVYWLFGVNHGLIRVLQAVMGACLPAILYLVANRRFPPLDAKVTAAMCTLYPALLGTSVALMTEAIYIPLLAIAVLILVLLEEQPTWGRLLLSGILLGVTLLARASATTLLLMIPFWMFLRFPKARIMSFVKGVVIGLIALITVLPWTARNWRVHHALIPISSNGGHIFWLGFHQLDRAAHQDFARAEAYRAQEGSHANSETYFQLTAQDNTIGFPMLQRIYTERYPDFPVPPDEASLNHAYFARTLDFMKKNPGAVVVKIIKDTLRVPYFFDHFGRYVFSWGCLFPFALAGLWITRKRWNELSLFYLLILSLILLEVVFHPTPRFRLPYEPFIIPFAAAAVVAMFRRFTMKHPLPYAVIVVVVIANLVFYTNSDSVRHLFRSLARLLGLPVAPF